MRAVLIKVLSNDDKEDDEKKEQIKKMTRKNMTIQKMIEYENEKLVYVSIAAVLGLKEQI